MNDLNRKPRSKRWFILIVAVCLVIFPLLLVVEQFWTPPTEWHRGYEVLLKAAEAVFIAGILALSVERFLLSEFAHELGREAW